MDLAAYESKTLAEECFICAFLAGEPGKEHLVVAEDEHHVAFLDRFPTLRGKLLAAPRRHVEHVVRDLTENEFAALMRFVHRVALALESVVLSERTYVYSLGSQQGNAHLHWHIAALPPGTPYREQQFVAIMTEHGVLPPDHAADTALAERIRRAYDG
ncbi:histidine triad (HIT) protein [Luteipulveratus halotolerans]|uniref:Histidine triad (HIT) protein n=2 Tax=Luteipulveratus halotolerans TaxID=1631356 RepID=A0A0L6CPI1_9MICO|nr:histidine triad (HIT) protein [Luteipulveratus halotolerans]